MPVNWYQWHSGWWHSGLQCQCPAAASALAVIVAVCSSIATGMVLVMPLPVVMVTIIWSAIGCQCQCGCQPECASDCQWQDGSPLQKGGSSSSTRADPQAQVVARVTWSAGDSGRAPAGARRRGTVCLGSSFPLITCQCGRVCVTLA